MEPITATQVVVHALTDPTTFRITVLAWLATLSVLLAAARPIVLDAIELYRTAHAAAVRGNDASHDAAATRAPTDKPIIRPNQPKQ